MLRESWPNQLFPRPSNKMTAQEYYDGERHCILITARDPIPKRMLVSVPEIQGRFIGTKLHTLKADFYEVAKMFGSVMSWNSTCFLMVAFYIY